MNTRVIHVNGRREVILPDGTILVFEAGVEKKRKRIISIIAMFVVIVTSFLITIPILAKGPTETVETHKITTTTQVNQLDERLENRYMDDERILHTITAISSNDGHTADTETVEPIPESSPELIYVGKCRITAYCACYKCCGDWALNRPVDENGKEIVKGAGSTVLISGISVAGKWPFGTQLSIPEIADNVFIVQDRTAQYIQDYYDGMIVDIYIDSHEGCYEYIKGLPEWADVYIVGNNGAV